LATLAVYDEVGKIADKEIIATEILPQLWRMSFGPLLNLEQVNIQWCDMRNVY
jgi:SCY1-like protein 2